MTWCFQPREQGDRNQIHTHSTRPGRGSSSSLGAKWYHLKHLFHLNHKQSLLHEEWPIGYIILHISSRPLRRLSSIFLEENSIGVAHDQLAKLGCLDRSKDFNGLRYPAILSFWCLVVIYLHFFFIIIIIITIII